MGGSALVGNITRVTAWLALVIEVFDFVEKGLGLDLTQAHHDDIQKLGIFLFLISLVTWLEASNKSLAKLDKMSSHLHALASDAERMDLVAKYGASAVWLVRLLHPENARFPHCRAGGQTLSELLLSTYTRAAEGFDRLRTGEIDQVTLTENSVINLFLENLVKSLPPRSVWLGLSRIQDTGAWEQESAEPSYYEFESALKARVAASTLTCFRVLCFADADRHGRMSEVAKHQIKTGLHVRSYVGRNLPRDLSLIWVPKTQNSPTIDMSDPIGFLQSHTAEYEPLCGVSFEIRGDREVYTMALVGPGLEAFAQLKIDFRQNWRIAAPYNLEVRSVAS